MAQETSGLTRSAQNEDTSPVKLGDSETDEITSEETKRLHSEIQETRENMGDTIDEIQERLSFANLSEQVSDKVSDVIESAKETAYDATLGKVVNFMKQARDGVMQSSMGKTVAANPIPFALIGIGGAMLAYNAYSTKNRRGSMSKYRTKEYLTSMDREGGSAGLLSGAADTVSDKASNAYDAVAEKASGAYESAADMANKAYSGAADAANRVYERAGELGSSAKENFDYYVEEKPLAVAAAAMAVGAAVGFAIPSTRYEGELMGEAKQNLMSKAEDTAGELVDKAKQVAAEAKQVVSRELDTPSSGTRNI